MAKFEATGYKLPASWRTSKFAINLQILYIAPIGKWIWLKLKAAVDMFLVLCYNDLLYRIRETAGKRRKK